MRRNVGLRLSDEFLAELDQVRGDVPRELWIRMELERAVARYLPERSLVPYGGDEEIEAGGKRPSPAVIEKAEKLATGRRIVGGMVSQPRPIVQKRGK